MPVLFAPTIRRDLIAALDGHVLPAMRSEQPFPMLLAEMPMQLPDEVEVAHLPIATLREVSPRAVGGDEHYWPELSLVRGGDRFAYMSFLFEGEADLRIGTTQRMAEQLPVDARNNEWAQRGCHILKLRAPAFLLLPPGVPRSSGGVPHWERAGAPANSRIFWMQISHDGLHCHLCETIGGEHSGKHALLVVDEAIPGICGLLHHELRSGALHQALVTRGLLGILMLRLHRRLVQDEPIVANTVRMRTYSPAQAHPSPTSRPTRATISSTIVQADEYIYTHLHLPLTVAMVARHCGLSPVQLNRTFRNHLATSVKQYIIAQRMAAAQLLLRETPMSIKEISLNLGFSRLTNFCQTFHGVAKVTPSQYRKQNRSTTTALGPEQ